MIGSIAIIIPYYTGDKLIRCLGSLFADSDQTGRRVIVVDDSIDGGNVIEHAQALFPSIEVLRNDGGRGFGSSCNLGLRSISEDYAVLLNDDTEVPPGWLPPMIAEMESRPQLGMCQPKILSLHNHHKFGQSAGAGGQMDILGYTFSLGSVIHTTENDQGQYDTPRPIFWAHGSAFMLRRSMLADIGYFDEEFLMQGEESDLCCRALSAGYDIRSVPTSIVFHYFGWSLKTNTIWRYYLSHRNTIVVMLKNWPLDWLLWCLPMRLLLELMTMVYGVAKLEFKQPMGVVMALGWLLFHPFAVVRRRRARLPNSKKSYGVLRERIFKESVTWNYFVRGKKTCVDLHLQ